MSALLTVITMTDIQRIAFTIAGAIAGSVATFVADRTITYLYQKRRLRNNLRGTWKSWWETKAESNDYPADVTESVEIYVSWWKRKVVITNRRNPGSQSVFDAMGTIHEDRFIGQYFSERNDDGTTMLTISANHDYMYGYWMGESFDQREVMGALAFGVDDAALNRAKKRLGKPQKKVQIADLHSGTTTPTGSKHSNTVSTDGDGRENDSQSDRPVLK